MGNGHTCHWCIMGIMFQRLSESVLDNEKVMAAVFYMYITESVQKYKLTTYISVCRSSECNSSGGEVVSSNKIFYDHVLIVYYPYWMYPDIFKV